MLLITQSQGLGRNFDVDFWAGVIRFSQNRFWGGTAGGGGCGAKPDMGPPQRCPDTNWWAEAVGQSQASGRGDTLRFDRVALGKSPSLWGPRFSSL